MKDIPRNPPDQNIEALFDKYKNGTCTEEEKALVEAWYLQYDVEGPELSEQERAADLAAIRASLPVIQQQAQSIRLWRRIAAAAAVIVVVSIAALALFNEKIPAPETAVNTKPEVIKPGSNKAFLTLADGSTIILNDATNGEIAKQSGIAITKTTDGKIIYTVQDASGSSQGQPKFNTIVTPRGGQYQVNLPDGTKVWLNAESSLQYPTFFTGNERRVTLKGEAYFEVSHNAAMPFRVVSNNQVVEVLGTHFNINSYADEPIVKTTLLEGAVMVKSSSQQMILKPGQQTVLNNADQTMLVSDANVESAVAWKNGHFMFNNENLQTMMRKIARWYDVDIEYKGNITSKAFGGTISKFENVSEVLKTIELTGVIHFTIEGRRIIVTP